MYTLLLRLVWQTTGFTEEQALQFINAQLAAESGRARVQSDWILEARNVRNRQTSYVWISPNQPSTGFLFTGSNGFVGWRSGGANASVSFGFNGGVIGANVSLGTTGTGGGTWDMSINLPAGQSRFVHVRYSQDAATVDIYRRHRFAGTPWERYRTGVFQQVGNPRPSGMRLSTTRNV